MGSRAGTGNGPAPNLSFSLKMILRSFCFHFARTSFKRTLLGFSGGKERSD